MQRKGLLRRHRRTPRGYDGTHTTTHRVGALLPSLLAEIGTSFEARPDLVLEAWPTLIGPQFASMTQAISLSEGVLTVKVANSPLLSILNRFEKKRLLSLLQKRFPNTAVDHIIFRIG